MSENQPIQEHAQGIITRAKAIIMSPVTEWPKISAETDAPMQVFLRYAVPLAAIGPLASIIGQQVFGIGGFGFNFRPSLMTSISTGIASYVLTLVSLWLVAWVANFLSPKFEGQDNFPAAFKLVAFSMTATWLAGIFGIITALSILSILGIYSLYLFYKGAQPMMNVPESKAVGYTVVTVLIAFVASIVVSMITAAIVGVGAIASGGMSASNNSGGSSSSSSGDSMTIDLGQYGRIEANEDGAVARFVDENGEEITIEVDAGE